MVRMADSKYTPKSSQQAQLKTLLDMPEAYFEALETLGRCSIPYLQRKCHVSYKAAYEYLERENGK